MAHLKFITIAISALFTGSLAAAVPDPAVAIIPTPPPAKDTHCPTVTSTGSVCSTCAVPKCLAWSTISNPCDCARTVPTVTVDFPCRSDGKHCGAGCLTMYKSATSTSTCNDVPIPTPPSPKTTVTTTETAASCTTTVTANIYETAKCTKGCVSDFCIVDCITCYSAVWLFEAQYRHFDVYPSLPGVDTVYSVLHGMAVYY
ncbi:uncharacterized protein E0L32_000752 [Thyridium curvatum]|uniref:Uncharacterized protein n=1 Tax=Thyridium curvatum TaxID=1093900 RepID=A0A507ANZ0_9PEZI|nr:uncharacterized protein E0L32_000752 [Thyridium curvatum]TPX12575.1 hypothetical protein E0L32_000752 [Thyridium curvatum]